MTAPQAKAVAALFVLAQENTSAEYFSRWRIGCKARGNGQGYPLKTLLAVQKLGLVEPEHEVAVSLVAQEVCRCGCDRWRLTDAGRDFCGTLNITIAKRETI